MTEDNALLVVIDTDDPPAADPRAVCRPTTVTLPVEGRWLLRTLVERLGKSPEQVLVMALERLYVQYPTGEVLDGGPAEYTLAADNGRHMSEIARDALKDGDAWICLNS
jgi:hypothetical protein